ncbi:hypothetical protein KEP48_17725 [Proteus mirabilis]|nr:hypothetical protein [Proteus mirabilis]
MRKVSIEQIDNLIRSVKLGKNRVGQKMVARFDKLAFVTTCEPKYLERIYKSLERVITNDVFQVKTYIPIGDMGELYHSAIYIKNKKKPIFLLVIWESCIIRLFTSRTRKNLINMLLFIITQQERGRGGNFALNSVLNTFVKKSLMLSLCG